MDLPILVSVLKPCFRARMERKDTVPSSNLDRCVCTGTCRWTRIVGKGSSHQETLLALALIIHDCTCCGNLSKTTAEVYTHKGLIPGLRLISRGPICTVTNGTVPDGTHNILYMYMYKYTHMYMYM